ncbi:MAG: carboxyl transferase domain-containing protein, partial [Vulcanimicrobiaceae bacterium]
MKTRAEKVAELARRGELALAPAGAPALDKQHARRKQSARERIAALVDPGSFSEFDRFVVHRTDGFGLDDREFLGD